MRLTNDTFQRIVLKTRDNIYLIFICALAYQANKQCRTCVIGIRSPGVLMTRLLYSSDHAVEICTSFTDAKLAVNLENGPNYGWTAQKPLGSAARVCLASNATNSKATYYTASCRCVNGCQEA